MSSTLVDQKRTILILTANPKNSTPLRLDEEIREIDAGLTRSRNREQFKLEQKWAIRHKDFQRAMLDFSPQIVHFSGHGVGAGGLVLENDAGQAKLVSSAALGGMFELFADQVECVVLNACYSEVQAEAIVQHIPYVIGMNQEVGDTAAREFAVGFYDALGAGKSIEIAYKFGCNSIRMAGIPEDLTPVLKKRSDLVELPLLLPLPTPELSLDQPEPSQVASVPVMLDEPEGQVPLDSALYVERPPIELRCYETIVKPGALIRIKAPRQMGKSSLTLRILNYGMERGYRATFLSLQSAGAQALSSVDQFLYWLCGRITRKLNLKDALGDYWTGALGSNDKCTDYFELYLLPEIQQPLVLCLDEVDELFKHPAIASDFFGLLRAWHEESKINPIWQNLRLVITHSKEVYIPLNINQSPFNVGVPIELPELNQVQVRDLVHRHGLDWMTGEVERLMDVVDGHPYLLRKALYEIVRGHLTLEQFVRVAPTQEGLYGDHLYRHLINLQDDPELKSAMRQMVMSEEPVRLSPNQAFKLCSMGLAEKKGNDVIPLCNLYRVYFRDLLGDGAKLSAANPEPKRNPVPTSPPEPEQAKEIYVSYAWGGDSEEMVNRIDAAFQAREVTIIRDKRDLGYKGLIKEFMQEIGRGKCIITVISDKYLKSPNCMFELVQIAENGQFYDRIFPIVLPDAQIYSPIERIQYVKHWEGQIKQLDKAMRGVAAANLQGFREEIDQYTQIRNTIAELVGILKNMNTLTPDMHSESGFEGLFRAIARKLAQ